MLRGIIWYTFFDLWAKVKHFLQCLAKIWIDRICRLAFYLSICKKTKNNTFKFYSNVIGSIKWYFIKKIANFLQVFLNYLYFLFLKEEVYVATPVLFPISSWFCGCGFGLLWSLITNGKVDGAEMTADQSCINDHSNIDFP